MRGSDTLSRLGASALAADLSSALVVSFLTIAAGSAFGVLTGLGAWAGIVSMIVATFVGGLFGGIPVKVSGPTGPTSAAMLATVSLVEGHGAPAGAAFMIVGLAALGLLVISVMPVERVMRHVPNAATAVFVNGVALVILRSQGNKIIDYLELEGSERVAVVATVAAATSLLFSWPTIAKLIRSDGIRRLLSGSLVVMTVSAIANGLVDLPVERLSVTPPRLDGELIALAPSALDAVPATAVLAATLNLTLTLAFVATVTTRALAATPPYRTELRNQAAGNAAVAVFGGVPASLGFVRIRILERAGAQTWRAGIATAGMVLGLVALAPGVLGLMPTAVFTAILIRAAWTSMDRQFLDLSSRADRPWATLILVVAGSLAMLWFSHLIVVVSVTVLWHGIRRMGLRHRCPDLDRCPIVNLTEAAEM